MMKVIKPFTTRSRRFAADAEIAAADLADDLVPLADRHARGFLEAVAPAAPAAEAQHTEEPAAEAHIRKRR